MTRKQKIFAGLAAAHLLLVAFSTTTLPLPAPGNPAGDSLRWYGAISGANNSYGFFKQVGCCFQVSFILVDENKNVVRIEKLNRGFGQEAELRFNSGVNLLSDLQNELVHHWAATMLGRYPEVAQVYVKIERFDPGTMEEYRDGNRPKWETLPYLTGFDRKSDKPFYVQGTEP